GDHHAHHVPPGAEAGAAQRPGPAEVVGERGAQRTRHHVGEPEGGDRVEPEPPPEHRGDQDDEQEHDRRREVAQAENAGGEVAEGGAESEGGEHHGPVVGLTPAGDDAVDRQRALAAVPEPEDQREHDRPQQRRARVRDADEQVQGVRHPGAEDRDRVGQGPVSGGDVAARPELPDQGDDHQARLHDPADLPVAQGQVVRHRLAAAGGEELDDPEQEGDLRHLRGERLREELNATGPRTHLPRPASATAIARPGWPRAVSDHGGDSAAKSPPSPNGVSQRYAATRRRRDRPEDEFRLTGLILKSETRSVYPLLPARMPLIAWIARKRPGTLPVGHHEGRTLGTMTRFPALPLAPVPACPPEQPPDEITRGLFGLGRRLTRTHPLASDALLAAVLLGLYSAWLSWSSWASYRAAIVQTALIAVLIVRRRYPSAVFLATSGIAFTQWLLGFPLLGDAALLVALYTVASHESRVRALLAAGLPPAGAVMAAAKWQL